MATPIQTACPATYAAGSRRPDLQFDAEEEPSEYNYKFINTFHVRAIRECIIVFAYIAGQAVRIGEAIVREMY